MSIQRVQIEEGFLDGLDVEFGDGLNVIIGARGTGKTSLIELIRYCLDVPGFSSEFTRKSFDHARAVLGSGQVTVSLIGSEGRVVSASRSASDTIPRTTGSYIKPVILSQTEIENVGIVPESRLKLIDGFIDSDMILSHDESAYSSAVRSFTLQCGELRNEIDRISRELEKLPEIDRLIHELEPQEQAISSISQESHRKSERLAQLTNHLAYLSVNSTELENFSKHLDKHSKIFDLAYNLTVPVVKVRTPYSKGLAEASASLKQARSHFSAAVDEVNKARGIITKALNEVSAQRLEGENEARLLRREIEQLQAGSGAIARQGQVLRERRAQIALFQDELDQNRRRYAKLLKERSTALDQLESYRDRKFHARKKIVDKLNGKLAPSIKLEISRAGQTKSYAASLASMLRGSGIRYNDLIPLLSSTVSPRELVEWAEEDNVSALKMAANLNNDRSARLLATLRSSNLQDLAVVLIEDDIQFFLLDGPDYKAVEKISTGQRCTVVLPILLEQTNIPLIIDQPEDHIDNAFIAKILIKSIIRRSSGSQLIVSTHNANIPVLGDAHELIQMGSDGRRGYVLINAGLNDSNAVDAITNVMEGGAAAFKQRAKFYGKHPSNES